MTDKLLPCPFCGGEPLLENKTNPMSDISKLYASCKTEGCHMQWYDIKVEAWNTRANPSPTDESRNDLLKAFRRIGHSFSIDNPDVIELRGFILKTDYAAIHQILQRPSVHEAAQDELDKCQDALHKIKQWADAYPEDIFIPVSSDEMKRANKILDDAGISMSAMHGEWARHIVKGISDIASSALPKPPESK